MKKPGAKVNEGDADLKNSRNIQSIEWVDRKPADRRFFKVTFKGSFPVDAYQNGQYVATVTSTDDLTYVTEIFDHHLSVVCRPNCQFSLAIIGDLKSK